jgi:hypothetical protein
VIRAAVTGLIIGAAAAVAVRVLARVDPPAPRVCTVEEAAVAERIETAAQQLHARRHRAGYAQVCGRCRTDARIVADTVQATTTGRAS